MIHVRRMLAALAACAALGNGAARAEAVWLGHYVPGIPDSVVVDIEVAGAPAFSRTLAYGETTRLEIDLPAVVRFVARRANGALVADSTTALAAADHSVALAGVPGTPDTDPRAPVLDFYYGEESPRAVLPEQYSMRRANFMVGPNASAQPFIGTTSTTSGLAGVIVGYGAGYRRASTAASPGNFGFNLYRGGTCRAYLYPGIPPVTDPAERDRFLANPIVTADFACLPGHLYRIIAIGDGSAQAPFALRVIDVNATASRPVVMPTEAMNGIWSIEGQPGAGMSIAIDTDAQGRMSFQGLLYGYVGGEPRWRHVEADAVRGTLPALLFLDVSEYLGGSPSGERATVPFLRGIADLAFHACDRATLHAPYPEQIGLVGNPGAGYALVRMLPARPCAATATEQGVAP